MTIGVDFDNTIIRYDEAFAFEAVRRGLVPEGVAPTKLAIRDHLRRVGREDDWTLLQGDIYGPGIEHATPFPGVEDFFLRCRELGVPLFIVSHKTLHPYKGPVHDLHAFARQWLADRGFFDQARLGLDPARVFFEPTKKDKAGRISDLGVTHFIDDLPEFLAELEWRPLERILFDPNDEHGLEERFPRAGSWSRLSAMLLEKAP